MRWIKHVVVGLLAWGGVGGSWAQVPLGANLDGLSDYSQSRPFVDVFLTNRGFGSANAPWEAAGRPPLDAQGWPLTDFGVIVLANAAGYADLNGTYRLSFRGQATVSGIASPVTLSNYAYDAATNRSTADLTLAPSPDGQIILSFRQVGAGGVQDIHLIRPGYTTETFATPFKQHLQRFAALRFMDWSATNGNPVRTWAERTTLASPSQATSKGVAWEYAIQLCNELGKDMWLNVPIGADDDYVRQLARLVHQQLRPELKIYLEYSNEVWNWQFAQATTNLNLAQAEVAAGGSVLNFDGSPSANDWAVRRTARQLVLISNAFRAEFGDAAMMSRVRPVLAEQVVNAGGTLQPALDFVNRVYGPPSQFFYAAAGAPYFNLGDADQNPNLSSADVLGALQANVQDIFRPSNTPASVGSTWLDQTVATSIWYGLRPFCYEGGPDTFGPNNVPAKKAASLDPAMTGVSADYLRRWYGAAGPDALFMWFVAGATSYDSPYGTWGLTNSMANLNSPKTQALDQVLTGPVPVLTAGLSVLDSVDTRQYVGHGPNWHGPGSPFNQYLHAGQSNDYLLRAPTAGTYRLRVRTLVPPTAAAVRLSVSLNNQSVATLTLAGTSSNNYNHFTLTDPVLVQLPAGLSVLRLSYLTENFANMSVQLERTTPLPVQLSAFGAARQGPDVQATWATASETNSAYFALEAAADGAGPFAEVGRVPAAGTSAGPRQYAATERQVPASGGLRYYRLRQVDLDGRVRYSATVAVALAAPAALRLLAAPLPFQGSELTVSLQAPAAGEGNLDLTDLAGRLLLSRPARWPAGPSPVAVPEAAALPPGVYVLRLRGPGGSCQQKLVKR